MDFRTYLEKNKFKPTPCTVSCQNSESSISGCFLMPIGIWYELPITVFQSFVFKKGTYRQMLKSNKNLILILLQNLRNWFLIMKVYHSEEICPRIFCFDKNCGSLLLSNIIHANLCSEIRPFHLIINFYNFDSTKIIIKGKLLRKVSFMIRNQFQEARSKIQRMCISLLYLKTPS